MARAGRGPRRRLADQRAVEIQASTAITQDRRSTQLATKTISAPV